MTQTQKRVEAIVTLTVDGTTQTFTADGTTLGDPHNLAYGVLNGVADDARHWIGQKHEEARAAARQALHAARMGTRR